MLCVSAAYAVEIRFVPPSAEGTISLGIYDSSGKLVRVLCDEWPIGNFNAGLNGLSTEWDGNDSAGQPVVAGTYTAKGFHAGDVAVDGDAFHFNDWITTDDAPRIVSVDSLGILAGGDLVLAARLVGNKSALLRYSPQNANPWVVLATETLAEASPRTKLAVAGGRVFFLQGKKLRAIDLTTGKEVELPALAAEPLDLGGREDRLAILASDGIKVYDATNLTERAAFPLPAVKAVAVAPFGTEDLVVAGDDGSIWHGAPEWKRLETPPTSKARALATGRGETFWVLERTDDGTAAVVQYSPTEGRLAEWVAPASGDPVALAGSVDTDYFAAVFSGADTERAFAIRRNAANSWELLADKTITGSSAFGLTDGKLWPSAGDLPSEITVALRENPLDPSAPRSLLLRAAALGGGTGLITADGLPLVRVSGDEGFGRLAVVAGQTPGTAQFYQGDGACVEEYGITNLGEITALNAGTIDMEGGAEKAPPPEEDPEIPTP
jgi:hypothetical protein